MNSSFSCLAVMPGHIGDPELLIAAVQGGGAGILDLVHCPPEHTALAERNLRRLLSNAPEGRAGLRLRPDQFEICGPLLALIEAAPHWLIVTGMAQPHMRRPGRLLLREITSLDQIPPQGEKDVVDGYVARGDESGGWIGEEPAFILAQKLAAAGIDRFYVQGGIGPHTAAACRVAGASGVVLEEQLLLMPESPLPAAWRALIESATPQDAILVGPAPGAYCRVLHRSTRGASSQLREMASQAEAHDFPERWKQRAGALIGWGDPERFAWPAGQMIGYAAAFRDQYGNTARLVNAVLRGSERAVRAARELAPLGLDSPLARSHGTEYPILQGPMTRVSDTAAFAAAVAREGALPFIALALMEGQKASALLRETRARIGGRPWGAGVLGFAPEHILRAQIAAIRETKPPFVLIAGGRPDQTPEFENLGIAAYIHAPAPSLLKVFIGQGARRFIFEGYECGGHIGPLSSFVLWEGAIRTLLAHTPADERERMHVVFAGGIHDALSAAMVSAMAAPLAEQGMRVGILAGTGYLFTREAVEAGAVVESFQKRAVACDRTSIVDVGPGHAIRCAASPFTEFFEQEKKRVIATGLPAAQVSSQLEHLVLGRLRIASKGIEREGDAFANVREDVQLAQGMYMIGLAATMRDRIGTVRELHDAISRESAEVLKERGAESREKSGEGSRIAVIGIGSLVPQAQNPDRFWRNLLDKSDAIREVPREYWDWRLYYDPDPGAPDKTYSKWGAFLDEVAFDPVRFGIPPVSLKSINPGQLLILEVVRRALADAGYETGGFDRENTCVILGSDGSSFIENQYLTRSILPLVLDTPLKNVTDRMPEWTDESFPGILNNVSAGRVANRFDFGGTNFVVDAACASSLKAIELAMFELESGRSNVAVAGGIDVAQAPSSFTAFSKTHALSARGRAQTFDKAADGIVISEAVAAVIMKRLEDAERDGDRIYAVIEGMASSSDGKAMGLTAPRPKGQALACRRAYRAAGIEPRTVALYEAHGTGTSVGDAAELETINTVLTADGAASKSCALGSLKTLIGHAKTAAGVLGLIKACLSLYHKTLPPHYGVENPLDKLVEPETPVFLLREPRPWFEHPDQPRRAAVSAFGFGGTNTHAILGEYAGNAAIAPGADEMPCELVVIRAESAAELGRRMRALREQLQSPGSLRLRDVAWSCAAQSPPSRKSGHAAAIVCADFAELNQALASAIDSLERRDAVRLPKNVSIGEYPAEGKMAGKVALLFPGQGAQHVNMAREAALYSPELRAAIAHSDRVLRADYPRLLSQYIFPPAAFSEDTENIQTAELADTHVAQAAIGTLSLGYLDILAGLGIVPDMACGHSYGEFTALAAAGALERDDFIRLSEARGRCMAQACRKPGAMAVVRATRQDLARWLEEFPGVVLANHNGPAQSVISGEVAAVNEAVRVFTKRGIVCSLLPVAGAFHSPLMEESHHGLVEALARCAWNAPRFAVYSNATGAPHPFDGPAIRDRLGRHLLSPVEFSASIERMYADGARVFIECGPKSILTGLAAQILGDREHAAIAMDGQGGGLRAFLNAAGALVVRSGMCDAAFLFARRRVRLLPLDRLAEIAKEPAVTSTTWYVNGVRARHKDDHSAPRWGAEPLLDYATATKLRERPSPAPPAAPVFPDSLPDIANPEQRSAFAVLQMHQETMRRFLAVQEDLMKQFLGGAATQGLETRHFPESAVLPQSLAARVASAGNGVTGNGVNGAATHEAAPPPAPAVTQTPATPPVAQPAAPNAVLSDRESLARVLLDIVSNRTGYPTEVLGLDMDLEAEIGIDSIKRIEILAALEPALPQHIAAEMQSRMEALTRVKTLNGLISRLLELESRRAAPDPAPPAGLSILAASAAAADPVLKNTPGAPSEEHPGCPRFVFEARPAATFQSDIPIAGLYIVSGTGPADAVASTIESHGGAVVRVSLDRLTNGVTLEHQVDEARRRHGAVRGLIHVPAASRSRLPEALSEWRADTQVQVKNFFALLQSCGRDIHEPDFVALVASFMGGSFGRDGSGNAGIVAPACAGILKTLSAEAPSCRVRLLDFAPDLPAPDVARIVTSALQSRSGATEIGFGPNGAVEFQAVRGDVDRSAPPAPVAGYNVWLVTGGARGITAHCIEALAHPGATIVVTGRTPQPAPEAREYAGLSRTELRDAIMALARAQGEHIAPARIEARVAEILLQREIRSNLDRLRAIGANVEYHAVDVRDENAMNTLIASVYRRHGNIDAVIHGAGIVDDKLIADKTQTSFDKVFDTKADGAFLLQKHLRGETLGLFVQFGSVSGRFGNPGQADYAAANELLNRLGWYLRGHWPRTRVVTINWGPWDGAGMANEAVRRNLIRRGIQPLDRESGIRFLTAELSYGAADQAEVVAGDGPWAAGDPSPASESARAAGAFADVNGLGEALRRA